MTDKEIDKLVEDTFDDIEKGIDFVSNMWEAAKRRNPVPYSHERSLNPTKPFNNAILEEILNQPRMNDEF